MPLEEPGSLLIATVAFSVLVATVVLIHHEVLVRLSSVLGKWVVISISDWLWPYSGFLPLMLWKYGSFHGVLCYAPYPGLGAANW